MDLRLPDSLPREGFSHGSRLGYLKGCRTRSMCRWFGSAEWLTCTEASTVAVGDAVLRGVPSNMPIPRPPAARVDLVRITALRHGTPFGYHRGCRTPSSCPNFLTSNPTCAEVEHRYRDSYWARRLRGDLAPIVHGTVGGYHAGCRDAAQCPGDEHGLTCTTARRLRRRAAAAGRGVLPRLLLDAYEPAIQVRRMHAEGMSIREIARVCGVGRTTVSGLLDALARDERPVATQRILSRLSAVC